MATTVVVAGMWRTFQKRMRLRLISFSPWNCRAEKVCILSQSYCVILFLFFTRFLDFGEKNEQAYFFFFSEIPVPILNTNKPDI